MSSVQTIPPDLLAPVFRHLVRDATQGRPLTICDADRPAAIAAVLVLLTTPPARAAHFRRVQETFGDAAVTRELDGERAVEMAESGPEKFTGEELARLLLSPSEVAALGLLLEDTLPEWYLTALDPVTPVEPPQPPARQARRVWVAVGLAAAILVAVFGIWRPWERPIVSGPRGQVPSYTEAPPITKTASGQLLGPVAADRELILTLPGCPEPAWVGVVEFGSGPPLVRTATDDACPEVRPNAPLQLDDIPFVRDSTGRSRVLVVWAEKPCGPALVAAVRDGTLRSFAPGAHEQLAREAADVLTRTGNRLIQYRVEILDLVP